MRFSNIVVATVAAIALAAPAAAHPKLLSSTPAADATVAAPDRVQLVFSEGLVRKLSRIDVKMTDMPGMRMGKPMAMSGKTELSTDGKTLTLAFAKPLPTGSYQLSYHVVSVDTHKVQGGYSFKVR